MKKCICLALALTSSVIADEGITSESWRPVYDKGKGDLVLDLSIGAESDDDEEEVFLYNPGEICVDRDGSILVIDPLMPSITKFGKDGNLVWTIDSKGQGPEDIKTPTQIAVNRDGSIIVYDIGNRRFCFVTEDGQILKTYDFSDWVWGLETAPDGTIWVETRLADFEGKRGGTLIKLLRYSSTFHTSVVVDSAIVKKNTYITKPVRTNVPVPFAPVVAWDIAPSGNIIIGRSSKYTVTILSPELELLTRVQHPGKHLEVTESDKETHFAGMAYNYGGAIEKGAPTFIRDNTEFPKYKPYFKQMHVDQEGFILFQTYETDIDGVIYDVFDPSGHFVNKLVLPELSGFRVITLGFVYQIETPEDSPATIKRYKVN